MTSTEEHESDQTSAYDDLVSSFAARLDEEMIRLSGGVLTKEGLRNIDLRAVLEAVVIEYEIGADPWRRVAAIEDTSDPRRRLQLAGAALRILMSQVTLVTRLRDQLIADAYAAKVSETDIEELVGVSRRRVYSIRHAPSDEGAVDLPPDDFVVEMTSWARFVARPLTEEEEIVGVDLLDFHDRLTRGTTGKTRPKPKPDQAKG